MGVEVEEGVGWPVTYCLVNHYRYAIIPLLLSILTLLGLSSLPVSLDPLFDIPK